MDRAKGKPLPPGLSLDITSQSATSTTAIQTLTF